MASCIADWVNGPNQPILILGASACRWGVPESQTSDRSSTTRVVEYNVALFFFWGGGQTKGDPPFQGFSLFEDLCSQGPRLDSRASPGPASGSRILSEEDAEDLADGLAPLELGSKELVLVPVADRQALHGQGSPETSPQFRRKLERNWQLGFDEEGTFGFGAFSWPACPLTIVCVCVTGGNHNVICKRCGPQARPGAGVTRC